MATDPSSPHAASPADLKARLEAEAREEPFLVLRDDADVQRIVTLGSRGGHVRVGRDAMCELALEADEQVSRLHAELEGVGTMWTLADHGLSRNGSFVNEQRVDGRRALRDGDVLRFGSTHVLFRAPAEQRARATRAATGARLGEPTPTQRAILVALCRPFAGGSPFATAPTNGQIAAEVHLSVDRVKAHLGQMYEAAGLDAVPQGQKRPRLAELALRTGVVRRSELGDP